MPGFLTQPPPGSSHQLPFLLLSRRILPSSVPLPVLTKRPPLASSVPLPLQSKDLQPSSFPRNWKSATLRIIFHVSIFTRFPPIQLLTGGPQVFLTSVFEAGPLGSQRTPFLPSSQREGYQKLCLCSTLGLPGQHLRDLGTGAPGEVIRGGFLAWNPWTYW